MIDRVKVATFLGTDRPHVLRQAIHCCRNFGTVSIVGVYGGLLDNIPMGSAINRGLTFRMAQTPVQKYLPVLLDRIQNGDIDPSFVITHRAKRPKAQGFIRRSATRQTVALKLFSNHRRAKRTETNQGVAIITGASSGIGRELARLAAEHGYDLLIAADEPEINGVAS